MSTITSKEHKTIKQFVLDYRNSGKTDSEIYTELRKNYPQKWSLYCIISSIPFNHLKKTYRILNNLLIALLGIVISEKVGITIFQYSQEKQLISLLPLLVCLLLSYVLVQIKNYNCDIIMHLQ